MFRKIYCLQYTSWLTKGLLLFSVCIAGVSLLPIGYLLLRASGAVFQSSSILQISILKATVNSLTLAIAVTLSSIIVGVFLAWVTSCTDIPFRRFWEIVTPLPLAFPSYLGAFTLIAALGPRGMFQHFLQPLGIKSFPSLYGFSGAWMALTIFTYPYILLCTRSALQNISASVEEVARSLGSSSRQTFWQITLPHLFPSIFTGALFVFLYTLSDFGAVSMMQFDSLTQKIYVQYNASFNRHAAAIISLILVLITTVTIIVGGYFQRKKRFFSYQPRGHKKRKKIALQAWSIPCFIVCCIIVFVSLVAPLFVLGFWLFRGIKSGNVILFDVPVLLHSVGISGISAIICVIIGIPFVAFTIRCPGRLSWLFERCIYLGHALPGIVIALSLVFFGIHYTPFLYQTFFLLIVAYIIRFLPEAVGSIQACWRDIPPSLNEAARTLGKTSIDVWLSITLPLLKPGILTGCSLVFLSCIKELPVTLLLAPTGFQTLATHVWSASEEAFYAQAASPALLLMGSAMVSMIFITHQFIPNEEALP